MAKTYAHGTVKEHDYTRYLISLFTKTAEQQKALWAIYALNYEIAKTREIVSDTTLGLIRLTWWREALRMIYGMPTEQKRRIEDHPVLPELAEAIYQFNLPYELFDQILLGREFDLEDLQPEKLEGLYTYLDQSCTPLIKLTAIICDQTLEDDTLQALGRAVGLTGLLKAIPFHAQHQIVMLPSDHIQAEDVLSPKDDKLPETIQNLYHEAIKLLDDVKTIPKGPIRAHLKAIRADLKHIKSCNFDPRHPKYNHKPAFYALKLTF